jgi:hypothetical protein
MSPSLKVIGIQIFEPDQVAGTGDAGFGALPDYFAAIAFDTANLVMHCLSRPEVTLKSQFVQTLKTLPHDNSVTSPAVIHPFTPPPFRIFAICWT